MQESTIPIKDELYQSELENSKLKFQKVHFTEKKYLLTLVFVISLFMLWGISITMGDILNRHFQSVLHISKSKSALVQFSMFGAYAVMGIPAGLFMKRFGYKNGVLLGLLLYSFGAFLFIPAANAESFTFFRIALFILACGLATLETVAHPFVSVLGKQASSDRRMNFAQGFNGLGGIIGSMAGGYFILRAGQEHSNDLYSVKIMYMVIGILILAVALTFFFIKIPPLPEPYLVKTNPQAIDNKHLIPAKTLFQHKHFIWAIVAQFCCVATQGGTWAFFINYGVEEVGLTSERAAYYFGLSMVMKMIGRFLGSFLMKYISPNKLLASFTVGSISMCLIIAQRFGWASFIALIMLNFFFSIMFPTIFSLGLKDLGIHKQQASSYIVMGVVGGAVFPPLMGLIANHNVAAAYYLPIICYAYIFFFAIKLSKIRK